jgi:intracellular septation protein A
MDTPSSPSAKPSLPPGLAAALPARENLWANLGFNIAVPALVMTKGQTWLGLPPLPALLIALAFPLAYGVYDLVKRRVWNIFSIIGLIGLVATGGIGLLKLSPQWLAVKDAAVPIILGIAVLATLPARRPLIQALLLNPSVVDTVRIDTALDARQSRPAFRVLLRRVTYLVAASFFLHGIVNYILVRHIVKHAAGTPEFTAEVGHLTVLSWPLIILPSGLLVMAALWLLLHGLRKLTGLEIEDMFHPEPAKARRP